MKQLFYFSAPSCEHCRALDPVMDQISKTYQVEKINTDYEADRAFNAKIQSIPTVVLAQDGVELKRFTGAKSYNMILNWINS